MTASLYAPDTHGHGDTWREQATCKADPDLFFPDGTTGRWLEIIDDAKATCRRCPVLDDCLDWITRSEGNKGLAERHGIWAATTAQERHNAHKRALRHAGRHARAVV